MILLKIGGGASIHLEGIVDDLAGMDERFIVVHGANALRDDLGRKLAMPQKVVTSISGYSSVLTDEPALDLMMMSYAGLRNKRIVELCLQKGIPAVGLTGLDGRLVAGRRNKGIRIEEEGRKKIVRDLSGKPDTINTDLLFLLLDHGYMPVITVPIADEQGCAINTENDDVVRVLSNAVEADRVIQLIEAPGLLRDPRDPRSLIEQMTFAQCAKWEEAAEGRMKRKLLALKKLGENRNIIVHISDGRTASPVKDALHGKGTDLRA
ncbi:MAG: [LysW]-aminoadipate kinase [Planctomycetota bacterium]